MSASGADAIGTDANGTDAIGAEKVAEGAACKLAPSGASAPLSATEPLARECETAS